MLLSGFHQVPNGVLFCSPQVLNRFPIGAHFMSIFLFFGASSLPLVHYIYVPWQLWHIYVQLVIDFEILIPKKSIYIFEDSIFSFQKNMIFGIF
jgi:hypothetical protein